MLEPRSDRLIVAVDHGLHDGVLPGFEAPGSLLETILEAGVDGLIAGLPFFEAFEEQLASYPEVRRIVTIDHLHESTLPGEDEGAEIQQQVVPVEDAARVGADAIKLVLVYGRSDPAVLRSNIGYVAEAVSTASEMELPVVVEPTLWGQRIEDDLDGNYLRHANRVAWELGADILKTPYPGDPAEFEPIVEPSPVPVYIAGGPALDSDEAVIEMIHEAVQTGAAGIMFGRNIWQRDDPGSFLEQIRPRL